MPKVGGWTPTLFETTLVVHLNDYLFKNCPCRLMPDFLSVFCVIYRYLLVNTFCEICNYSLRHAVHILRHDVFELAYSGQHGHLHHSLSVHIFWLSQGG